MKDIVLFYLQHESHQIQFISHRF